MTKIHHANFGGMRAIPTNDNPTTICHCLILEDSNGLALIDSGLGLLEMQKPLERFGEGLLNGWGFTIDERLSALVQLKQLGIMPKDIKHILLTHADVDHAGGLRDFPDAEVHLLKEELDNINNKNPRYLFNQFEHNPKWKSYSQSSTDWYGIENRAISIGFSSEISFIVLKGHTLGHTGVAVQQEDKWILHAGDTYYRFDEVINTDSRVNVTATHSSDDNNARLKSLETMRKLKEHHATEISFFSTHDILEFKDEPGEPVIILNQIHLSNQQNK